jgi:hypothetical protein
MDERPMDEEVVVLALRARMNRRERWWGMSR